MKSSIWLGAGALVAMSVAGASSALAQIAGTFAITSTENCIVIVPPETFSSEFQVAGDAINHQASNSIGTISFKPDGTGSVDVPLGVVVATQATSAAAGSYQEDYQFTYTINNGEITTTLVSGSYTRTYLSGFRAGLTSSFDVLNDVGYLSGNELLLMHNGTYVKTESYSDGVVRPQVCTSSTRGNR